MPTATINSTTWRADNTQRLQPRIIVRPRAVQPGNMLLPVTLTFFVAAIVRALHEGGSFALPLFLACCGLVLALVSHAEQPWCPRVLSRHSLDVFFAISALTLLVLPAGHEMHSVVITFAAGAMPLALTPAVPRFNAGAKRLERILVIGEDEMAEKLCRALDGNNFASRAAAIPDTGSYDGLATDFNGLDEVIERDGITRVIVAAQSAEMRRRVAGALIDLRLCGLEVNDAADFYEATFGKIWLEALNSEWFVYNRGFRHSKASVFLKRCVDIAFSICLLLITAPLLLVIAAAIKLDSDGPVFFRQTRVGLFGKPFTILKFRSMQKDAEVQAGPRWATKGDDRITRVGRILRRLRLDEIPQVFNVLRGEMSVVGPRPERPVFVGRLSRMIPFYDMRHYVKPGITGWAQVKYRYGNTLDDAYQKLQYDLYYVKHRSLLLDLNTLFRTVGIVLFAKGL